MEFTEFRRVTTECQGKQGRDYAVCMDNPFLISDDDPEYQAFLKKYRGAPTQKAGGAGRAAFAVILSGAIGLLFGYGFFNLTAKSAAGNGPNATGLKLARWLVFLACIKTSNDVLGPFFSGVSHRHDVLFVLFMDIVGFGIWALVAYAAGFAYAKLTARNDVQKVGTASAGLTPSSALAQPKSAISPTVSEDDLFAAVAKELMHNHRDEGLWTKAFALENGDDRKTKAHYIRLRVQALKEGAGFQT